MTGPGAAATTRTSTPKSLSFFSIRRDVISSVSGATPSCFDGAPSSKSTCGSLESGMSLKRGFCLSLMTRSLLGISTNVGSIKTGTGWCSSISMRSSINMSSRSLAAFLPTARSSAISRFSRRDSIRLLIHSPSRWAVWAQEKLNTLDAAITPIAIKTKPDPEKPSHLTPARPTQ